MNKFFALLVLIICYPAWAETYYVAEKKRALMYSRADEQKEMKKIKKLARKVIKKCNHKVVKKITKDYDYKIRISRIWEKNENNKMIKNSYSLSLGHMSEIRSTSNKPRRIFDSSLQYTELDRVDGHDITEAIKTLINCSF